MDQLAYDQVQCLSYIGDLREHDLTPESCVQGCRTWPSIVSLGIRTVVEARTLLLVSESSCSIRGHISVESLGQFEPKHHIAHLLVLQAIDEPTGCSS